MKASVKGQLLRHHTVCSGSAPVEIVARTVAAVREMLAANADPGSLSLVFSRKDGRVLILTTGREMECAVPKFEPEIEAAKLR